jgi:hypothetical protein
MPCDRCSINAGRSSCLYCGSAIHVGRQATDVERYRTSEEHRQAQLERSLAARMRQDPEIIDQRVMSAIRANLKPLTEFTHNDLIPITNLNACALKHCLVRLAKKRLVAHVGEVKIRANRYIERWQFLAQPSDYAPTGSQGASKAIRKATSTRAG